jgi:hypothetical protein
MFQTCIGAVSKTFANTNEAAREEAFEILCKLIRQSFPERMKVTVSDILKWGTTAAEFKQFFTLIDIFNEKKAAS